MHNLIDDIIERMQISYEMRLNAVITLKLINAGYSFDKPDEIFDFLRERGRVEVRGHIHELFVDDKPICQWSTEIKTDIDFETGQVRITRG